MNRPGLALALGLGVATPEGVGEAWPPVSSDGVVALIAIDLDNNRLWWGGQSRQFSDLTVVAGAPVNSNGYQPASGDRLALPAAAFAQIDLFAGTIEAEYDQVSAATSGQVLLSLAGGFGGTRSRFELYTDGNQPKLYCQYHNGTSLITVGDIVPASSYPYSLTRRRRAVLRYSSGAPLKIASGTALTSSGNNFGVSPNGGDRWSANGLMYRQWDNTQYFVSASLKRLIFWPQAVSDAAALQRALRTTKTNLFMLADSFGNVVSSAPRLQDAIAAALTPEYRDMKQDGVAGRNMTGHAAQFSTLPQFWGHTLVLLDGSGPDEDMATVYLPKIAEIAGRLNPGVDWVYIQGGINRLSTPSEVAATLALYEQVRAAFPNNYGDTYDHMRNNGTGTTTGVNGGEVWRADNYGDDLHPSAMGDTNFGARIAQIVTARGR